MMSRTGTFAEEAVLSRFGADILPERGGITYKGWTFRTTHAPIVGEQGLIDIAHYICDYCGLEKQPDDSIVVGQSILHIPPMIFGSDVLNIVHNKSMTSFSFVAKDALACWAKQHTEEGYKSRIAKVPYAREWAERHKVALGSTEDTNGDNAGVPDDNPSGIDLLVQHVWDWTFTNDYCCSLGRKVALAPENSPLTEALSVQDSTILRARDISVPAAEEPSVLSSLRQIGSSGIDVDMLRQRQDILFYDEIILYQDDLEDCGEVSMDVKIRVMPTCWFVLSRVFTRVDGSSVSIRDTRLFHCFGTNNVFMDILWQQKHIEPSNSTDSIGALQTSSAEGAPRFPLGPSTAAARDTRSSFGAPFNIPPNQIRDPNAWSRVLPDVTVIDGIHKNFEIILE